MRAAKEHIVTEYSSGRIKTTEYSQVYLGGMQSAMSHALELLMGKDKLTLELAILEIAKDKALIEKDTALAQKLLVEAQVTKIEVEVELAELEKGKTSADILRIEAQTILLTNQGLNAVKEGELLDAQVCKTKREFDLLGVQIPKVEAETGLLSQKKITEQAQTNGAAVSDDSVIGKQIKLYGAQSDGFQRDAEQKAAKLMIDTWNVRRTTDEGEDANDSNQLTNAHIGSVVAKLLEGVNAVSPS
jgi:hypothetical protein